MRIVSLLLVLASILLAQDSGQVLWASVMYNTAKASPALSPEIKNQADALGKQAAEAWRKEDFREAMRHFQHGFAIMRGAKWTPVVAHVSALLLKSDHAVWDPGMDIALRFEDLFEAPAQPMRGRATLQGNGDPIEMARWERLPKEMSIKAPSVQPGMYRLQITIEPEFGPVEGGPVTWTKTLNIRVAPGLRARMALLNRRLSKLVDTPLLARARYVPELFESVDRGEANPAWFDFNAEFNEAGSVIDAVAKGASPYAGRTGVIPRAYRSNVDSALQPYRLFVPDSYDANNPAPLVIALHGMGGNENTLDVMTKGGVDAQASKFGFLVAYPKGRAPTSMYRGTAERDVLDVIAEVRRDYRIDANRIYLMGHSMGAYGTWSIAMNHPDVFAALAPIAGGGDASKLDRIRGIPEIVFHGDADGTVPVTQSRTMVEAARKLNIEMRYVEIPGGDHSGIVAGTIPEMFAFFNEHAKKRQAKAAAAQ